MGLTSCLGDTSNTITQDFSAYCLSYVSDINTGTDIVTSGTSYRLLNDMDKGTITIEIGNLKLPNGTYVSLTVADQRYRYSESGAMTLSLPSYTSVVGGMSHTITDLKFEYYSRYLGQQSFPMILLSYTLDNQYTARVIYSPAYYWGTTNVVDQDGKVYVNSAQTSFYGVQFDTDKRTATVGAFSAKFAENMPALNMTFKDLPYVINQSGYSVTKEELTPYIGETPYPSYKITDFTMSGMWGGTQYISFTCTIDTEKVKGEYRVSAQLTIMPVNSSTGSN